MSMPYLPAIATTLASTALTGDDNNYVHHSSVSSDQTGNSITKAVREELCLYFAHVMYALNTILHRGYYTGPLKISTEKYGLSRD
jgi:hypothetical protein